PATMFVTAFAGILDVESGHLDFCCAGHEPPWYIQADGTLTRLEGIGGPPLCLLDEFDYPTDSIQLAPGDKLIVVTDGITEAVNRENELFGVERTDIVIDAISGATDASEALSGLVDPIHVFADGEEPADDLTALIVVWGAQT
ncbi:MAG: PP2C family protein-serine/threonine phosphatase, partial [Alphaproteobacteria bacterium]